MQNTVFINFLQGIMIEHGEWMDDMRVNADAKGNGVLYVIDERSPKPVEGQEWIVRSDDLIGEFDVKDGEIVPGSYRPNPDFALLNEEGLFQLTDEIAENVVAIEPARSRRSDAFVGRPAHQLRSGSRPQCYSGSAPPAPAEEVMTPEELNRTMEFIVASQARVTASLDRLEAAQEEDRRENKKMLTRLADLQAQQADLLVHQSERMDRLDKVQGDLTQQIVHLLNMILDRLPPLIH
jgi:hypothetical protein